jgi:hypothetical protein
MTTTETTDREHAAMEAAGMDDAELEATVRTLRHRRVHDEWTMLRACVDEQEHRARARFLNRVHKTNQR